MPEHLDISINVCYILHPSINIYFFYRVTKLNMKSHLIYMSGFPDVACFLITHFVAVVGRSATVTAFSKVGWGKKTSTNLSRLWSQMKGHWRRLLNICRCCHVGLLQMRSESLSGKLVIHLMNEAHSWSISCHLDKFEWVDLFFCNNRKMSMSCGVISNCKLEAVRLHSQLRDELNVELDVGVQLWKNNSITWNDWVNTIGSFKFQL